MKSICLQKKEEKTTDMTLRNLSYIRMFSNRKKRKFNMMFEIYLFQFFKNTFCSKINLTTK